MTVTNFKSVLPGTAPMAADIDQMRMALSGTADVGAINLAPAQNAPNAPVLALGGVGVVNYAVIYQLVAVTGWLDSYANPHMSGFAAGAEATITPSNQIVLVTVPAFTMPIIGYAIYRTAGAGATGTESFVGYFTNPAGGTFSDNATDSARGTGMPSSASTVTLPAAVPTVNTTGTTLTIGSYINNKPFIAPTLLNGWINLGAGYNPTGYYKDEFNMVHLRGIVQSGTCAGGTPIFTFPQGYRPLNTQLFSVATTGDGTAIQICTLVLHSNGNFTTDKNVWGIWTQLDGISFRAEQ